MHKLEIKNLNIETGGLLPASADGAQAGKNVAEGISLAIKSGEVHILMGPNGSGKSSLLNGIFGHPKYKISGGEIILDGKNITELSTDKKAKAGLFLSMQNVPEIAGVSILQFLHRAHRSVSGKEVSIIDFNKNLVEKISKLGIDKEILRRNVNTGFSGGEKKIGELVQLVALPPKFAFLDEIDSGVDVDSLSKVFQGIEELKKEGTGFLLITHYTNILKKITPDFVHIMKNGKIVKFGGHELVIEIEKSGFGT